GRPEATSTLAASEEQACKQLEGQLYYQTVGLVERERAAGNSGRAEQLLDGSHCPPHLRGWEWHYLKRLRFGGSAPIRYPTLLWALAISPDGRWLAVGGDDGIVRLRNVQTREEVRSLQVHGRVRGLGFSPDNGRIASSTIDGTVEVWSVASG